MKTTNEGKGRFVPKKHFCFDITTDRWAGLIARHMEKCASYHVTRNYIWIIE